MTEAEANDALDQFFQREGTREQTEEAIKFLGRRNSAAAKRLRKIALGLRNNFYRTMAAELLSEILQR
jgi:hypothetical protein